VTPTSHALLSASAAHRWLECTAAPRFESQFPEGEVSVYAVEGTVAHEVCELEGRIAFNDIDSITYMSRLSKLYDRKYFDPEMSVTARAYVDYLKEKALGFKDEPSVFFETRVDLSKYIPEGFGTCDCIMVGGDRLHITDYKHGKGVAVSAKNNPQMMLYALGALELYAPFYDIKTVSMGICQPRLHADVEEDEMSVEELIMWGENVVKPAARAAYDGVGDFQPGEHCRFCKGRAQCRARAEAANSFMIFKDIPKERLTDSEIGDLLRNAKWLSSWYEDLSDYALKAIMDGKQIDGYKVVEGRSIRAFRDTDEAFEIIRKAGFDDAMLYDRKPKTLAALEKLVGKKKFSEILGDQIVTPAGKPTLADADDRRKEWNSAEADFKGVF